MTGDVMAKALFALLTVAAVSLIVAWQSGVLSEPVEVCEIDKTTRVEHCAVHGTALAALMRVGKFFERHGDAIVAAFAIVLAMSTILLWLATRRLQQSIAALHEAGERQIAVARQSADAATRAAAAAEASAKAMTDTAQTQLRVYASVQAALIELLEPPRDPLRSSHDQGHGSDPGL